MTEHFLRRWSRLKRDQPDASAESAVAPRPAGVIDTQQLPALESLQFSSDFTAFMGEEVEGALRRDALQKLFHAEHFNVMDGLDVYIEDYNTFEPVSAELLANLNQARGLIFDDEKPVAESPETSLSVEGPPAVEPIAAEDIVADEKP